jgi:hypothetical protein
VDPNNLQTNYTVSLDNGILTVGQAAPAITWTNPPSILYGTALATNQLNATANVSGSFAYLPTNGSVLNAGTNALSVVFTPADVIDYLSVTNSVSLVVSPAALTITAANTNRPYGQSNPVFTGSITGLTNGDNITAAYTTAATINSPAGTYAIIPSLIDPNNRQTNYTVSLVNGTITITTPPVIQSVSRSGNLFTFTWSTLSNQTYQIQYTSTLTQGGWGDLGGAITATNATTTAFEFITNAVEFYRIVLLP